MSQYETKCMAVDESKLLCGAGPGVSSSLSLITDTVEEATSCLYLLDMIKVKKIRMSSAKSPHSLVGTYVT